MASHVRLLVAPTADTPGTMVQLHHDETGTYLFGSMSEGTQRAMIQRKFQIGRIRRAFISGPVNWHTIGGLLGMILTIADVRASSIEHADVNTSRGKRTIQKHFSDFVIHGGPNLRYALASARSFIFRKGLPLKVEEIRTDPRLDNPRSTEPDYTDGLVKVWYVPLCADGPLESQRSSRKRSHEQMDHDTQPEKEPEQSESDRLIIDEAVKGMFDPEWSMDKLETTTLKDAPRDAKLFVRNNDGEMEPYTGPRSDAKNGDMLVFVRKPWPGAQIRTLPPTTPVRQSICYIVRNQDRRGKFKADEAIRLGVNRRDNTRLTKGETVIAQDGSEVTPDMVMEPPVEGSGFAIIDIPDESYIPSFLARPEWDNKDIFKNIEKITWTLGPGVVDDHRIHDFMRIHRGVRHSVAAREVCPNQLPLGSAAETAARFHRIDPERFSIPDFNNIPQQFPPPVTANSEEKLFQPAVLGETLRLAPRTMEIDEHLEPNVDLGAALQVLSEETISLAGKAQQTIRDPEFLRKIEEAEQDIPNRDMEIISLGTGSALPSKHRNVSGTLIRIPGVGSYLFDCGENTLGSLRRLLGNGGAEEVLRDLRVIWISHVHADHHLGTTSFIRAWRDATQHLTPQPRLLLACSLNMANYFSEYKNVEDFGYDRLVLGIARDSDDMGEHIALPDDPDGTNVKMSEFGLKRIDACRVNHCYGACATVLQWPSGLKVAYSGDCRPSERFARIGKDATLLIHESTFEDGLEAEAVHKKHCTMSEALGVAKKMRARRVLLTHFSQRYPKFPMWDSSLHDFESDSRVKDKVVILMAFDLMRVKLGEFRQAAQFLPALGSVFREEIEAELKEAMESQPVRPEQSGRTPMKKKLRADPGSPKSKHKAAIQERRHSSSKKKKGTQAKSPQRDDSPLGRAIGAQQYSPKPHVEASF